MEVGKYAIVLHGDRAHSVVSRAMGHFKDVSRTWRVSELSPKGSPPGVEHGAA
jgi:hypothetical protein